MPRARRTLPWLDERNGVFYACWYDEAKGRNLRESLRTKDEQQAKHRFAEFLVGGPKHVGRPAGLTVSLVLDDYFREHVTPHVSDTLRQKYAIRHLKDYFTDTPIADVDIPKSRGYAEARRKGLIGGGARCKNKVGNDSTIRRELNVLIAAANHAKEWRRLTADQLPQVELPTEAPAAGVQWLTKGEVSALFKAADDLAKGSSGEAKQRAENVASFLRMLYYTAARRRAIEHLTRFQADLKNSRITLAKPGEKMTRKRKAIVPLYPEIRPDVERLLEAADTEYLFGGNRDFYREFVAVCKAAKITAHPHMLRHSRATHMLMDGESIYKVARLLGDTVATVERVYGHWSTDYLATESGLAITES
jgi:integrase